MRRCIESRGGVPFFVCGNRQSFQDDLLGGLKKINTTAAKTFDQQLSSNERNTIQLNKQILELADEHAGLKAQLHEDLPPDRKRAVERRIQSVQKKAFKAQRDFKKSAAKVKNPTRLDGLVGDVDLKQFGFDSATVVDAKEARTRAAGVQFISDVKTRKVHGIYVDSDGNALRGPDNRRNGRWRATNGNVRLGVRSDARRPEHR